MEDLLRDHAVLDARSISGAAGALLRAVQTPGSNIEQAAERLEKRAVVTLDANVAAFDDTDQTDNQHSAEVLLADSLSHLSIGLTLIAAESAVADQPNTEHLGAAIATLDRTADELELAGAVRPEDRGFDTRPGGRELGVIEAANAALDEMAANAAEVASSLLSKVSKPLVGALPHDLQSVLSETKAQLPGRFIGLGLRAVRRGLDVLLALVDISAVERARDRIDHVLERLGHGSDIALLTGWAIGTVDVSSQVAAGDPSATDIDLVEQLADLAERYGRLCALLKRVAGIITGVAAVLALASIAVPHSAALMAAGLSLVLGAVIVLGRDFTGTSDLPGKVRGVRLLMVDSGYGRA